MNINERDNLRFEQRDLHKDEKDSMIATIYPFRTPPQEILNGTYIIKDPMLQLSSGLHLTTSSILLLPRKDKRVLVPAVALDAEHPSINIKFLAREGMPETYRS